MGMVTPLPGAQPLLVHTHPGVLVAHWDGKHETALALARELAAAMAPLGVAIPSARYRAEMNREPSLSFGLERADRSGEWYVILGPTDWLIIWLNGSVVDVEKVDDDIGRKRFEAEVIRVDPSTPGLRALD